MPQPEAQVITLNAIGSINQILTDINQVLSTVGMTEKYNTRTARAQFLACLKHIINSDPELKDQTKTRYTKLALFNRGFLFHSEYDPSAPKDEHSEYDPIAPKDERRDIRSKAQFFASLFLTPNASQEIKGLTETYNDIDTSKLLSSQALKALMPMLTTKEGLGFLLLGEQRILPTINGFHYPGGSLFTDTIKTVILNSYKSQHVTANQKQQIINALQELHDELTPNSNQQLSFSP